MGNDASKQLEPNYVEDDCWVCGGNEMNYIFPDPKDNSSDDYLTSGLEEKSLTQDPEFNRDKILNDTKSILAPLWPKNNNNNNDRNNKLYIFYVHNMSPLLLDISSGNKKKNEIAIKNSDNIDFDACLHASLFRMFGGDCDVYCPKFRMQLNQKKGKNNSYELQSLDIKNAFRQFILMIGQSDQLNPFIVAAQGVSSGIMFNELIKLKNKTMQSLLVSALLPGYPLPDTAKNSWFGNKLQHWRTFKINDSSSYIFEDILENDEKTSSSINSENCCEMINPVTFSTDFSSQIEQNFGSLVREIDTKKTYFHYQIAKCDITINKSNEKGVLLVSNDNRLKDSFGGDGDNNNNNGQSEYLIYWLAIRYHIKALVETFYKNTLPGIKDKHRRMKEEAERQANLDDL